MADNHLEARANALPRPDPQDYHVPPRRDEEYRKCDDRELRRALFAAGLAEEHQRGRAATGRIGILRLTQGGAPKKARNVAASARKPTVEEMAALVHRIIEEEKREAERIQLQSRLKIGAIKAHLGSAEGAEFDDLFQQLQAAMRQRDDSAADIRAEAFTRVARDTGFEERRFLDMLDAKRRV